MANFGLDNAADLGLNIVIPGGGAIADILSNIVGDIGIDIKGKTPLMDWDTENKIACACVDEVTTAVLAQIPLLSESSVLAALAVQELDNFSRSYQTDVENLAGIRQSINYDNWTEAVGKPEGIWDVPTLAAKLNGNKMYHNSFWRCAMFILYNISSNSDDTTLPSRIVALYAWHTALIKKFSTYIGRTIDPIATNNAAIIKAAGQTSPEQVVSGVKDVTVLDVPDAITSDVAFRNALPYLLGLGLLVVVLVAYKKKG